MPIPCRTQVRRARNCRQPPKLLRPAPDGHHADRSVHGAARRSAAFRPQLSKSNHARPWHARKWHVRLATSISPHWISSQRMKQSSNGDWSKTCAAFQGFKTPPRPPTSRLAAAPGVTPCMSARSRAVAGSPTLAPATLPPWGFLLLTGRSFTDADTNATPLVLIVNQAFIRKYIGAGQPIGKLVHVMPEPQYPERTYQIVGTIPDTRYSDLREDTPTDRIRSCCTTSSGRAR